MKYLFYFIISKNSPVASHGRANSSKTVPWTGVLRAPLSSFLHLLGEWLASGLSSQGSSHQAVRTYCSVAEWFQQWGKVQEICLLVENKWYYVSASCFAFMEESHLSSCFSVQWTVRGWVYMNAFRVLYSPAYIPLLFLFFCHEKSMQITGKKKKGQHVKHFCLFPEFSDFLYPQY